MNMGEFKSSANEVGQWLWGTLQGGFNDKQTIGQILTDAVISMFPIAGDITAARDAIASVLRMAEYPEKREEPLEWVALVLALLAVVPFLGGALKGIGKLLLRAGKSADEDRKILEACIWLLNRIGEGNAVKFIRELDFMKYADPIKKGAKEVLTRISDGIDFVQQRFRDRLPESVVSHMQGLKKGLAEVRLLVDKMVPQALKELNQRLKVIQKLTYEGDWHLIPGAGKALTRETEARLVHDALLGKEVWKLEEAKWPPNTKEAFVPKEGWPDLKADPNIIPLTNGKKLEDHYRVAAFSGPITPKVLPEGTVIYRVITQDEWSKAEGAWWTMVDPKSINGWYWRVKFAVLQSWSANGKYVKYAVKDKPLHAWEGKVASQIDQDKLLRDGSANVAYGQYLEGGETQLYIDFKHESNVHALPKVKAMNDHKLNTDWIDHMGINIPERGATAQKLGTYEVEQKSLTSANLATAANQGARATRAENNRDERAR